VSLTAFLFDRLFVCRVGDYCSLPTALVDESEALVRLYNAMEVGAVWVEPKVPEWLQRWLAVASGWLLRKS